MQGFPVNPVALAPRARLAGACAAFGASTTLLGMLVAMFATASSCPWLPDNPDAIAEAARCDQAASRVARDQCVQQAALRRDAAGLQAVRVASTR